LRSMQEHLRRAPPAPGFIEAVVDPLANALACASGNVRQSQPPAFRQAAQQLVDEAVRIGPQALSAKQKSALLGDAPALSRLHFQVWASPDAHPKWFSNTPAATERRAVPRAAPRMLTQAAAG